MLRSTLLSFFKWIILVQLSTGIVSANENFINYIPYGTPVIDGKLSSDEWFDFSKVTTYKFYGEDSTLKYYLMWDEKYLYFAAEIEDFELWVDNYNENQPWSSTWDDDSIKLEIDVNNLDNKVMDKNARIFAINANGSAYRFDKGDDNGNTIGAKTFDDIISKTTYKGIMNDYTFNTITDPTDKDEGYVVEVAISWRNLYGNNTYDYPVHGLELGINITNIEDDNGGLLDPSYKQEWKRPFDEITSFIGEENYPNSWPTFILSSANDYISPSPIDTLSVDKITAFSATFSFTAVGDNNNAGIITRYDIRYSEQNLTEETWNSASQYKTQYKPKYSGEKENIQIIGLQPNKTYYLGIKAIDKNDNASKLSTISLQTTSMTDLADKGYITVCKNQKYLCYEDGTQLFLIGDNQGIPWPNIRTFYNGKMWDNELNIYRNFYTEEGVSKGRKYLEYLSAQGVNTIRIMAESYDIFEPVYLIQDASGGVNNLVFNENTLDFLELFLDECNNYGINVIIVPFDTYYYKNKWDLHPFSIYKSGPFTSANDLFLANNRIYLKKILEVLVNRLKFKKNLLAWDILNEFDSIGNEVGWHNVGFSLQKDTVEELGQYIRSIDSNHLTYISSVQWDIKNTSHSDKAKISTMPGDNLSLILNDDLFSLNSTHMYYHDIRDPNLNNINNNTYQIYDSNKTISPAVKIKQGLQYYSANNIRTKPYFDSEYGPEPRYVSGYNDLFTQNEDEIMFLYSSWSHLANGGSSIGLRWPGEQLKINEHALLPTMRKYQHVISRFLESNISLESFNPICLNNNSKIVNTSIPLILSGIYDDQYGIVFLIKDERKKNYPMVENAKLIINDLPVNNKYRFEFWNISDSNTTIPTSFIDLNSELNSTITVNIPTFMNTIAIKFFNISNSGLPQIEKNALNSLYKSTNFNNWFNKENWLLTPGTECSWYGITCDSEKKHIISISLSGNNLTGVIPPELGNLLHLKTLNLSNNHLDGALPNRLKELKLLNGGLDLNGNNLKAHISFQEWLNKFHEGEAAIDFFEINSQKKRSTNLSFIDLLILL